jgi:hypothetical protein
MNSAIDAVNPCNALRPAIGPISPAAKKPASGMPPRSPPPTPVAGEQQRPGRTPGQLCSRPLHGQAQVLIGPGGVTDLELHRGADLDGLRGKVRGQQFGEASTRRRAAFTWLVHHGISRDEGRAEQSGGHRDGVVPRREHRHHTAGLRHHEIGRRPRALQTAAAVHRSQLGVLHQCSGSGVDATACVVAQLAGLPFVQFSELAGRGTDVDGSATAAARSAGAVRAPAAAALAARATASSHANGSAMGIRVTTSPVRGSRTVVRSVTVEDISASYPVAG